MIDLSGPVWTQHRVSYWAPSSPTDAPICERCLVELIDTDEWAEFDVEDIVYSREVEKEGRWVNQLVPTMVEMATREPVVRASIACQEHVNE